jgi:hypothetical protein
MVKGSMQTSELKRSAFSGAAEANAYPEPNDKIKIGENFLYVL